MKKREMSCPACGQRIERGSGNFAVCGRCGKRILLRDAASPGETFRYVRIREQEQERARAMSRREGRRVLGVLLVLFSLLLLAAALYAARVLLRPKVNPFDYVQVSFAGPSGAGEAALTLLPADGAIDPEKIDYQLSPRHGLSEGDTVTVSAHSGSYRLSAVEAIYTVAGLETLLSDLASLDDAALSLIHAQTEEMNRSHTTGNDLFRNELLSSSPARLFLLYDGKGHNLLYDVYEAAFALADGSTRTVFLAAYYEDILVRDGAGASIDYAHSMYSGNVFSLGGDGDSVVTGYADIEEAREAIRARGGEGMEMTEW